MKQICCIYVLDNVTYSTCPDIVPTNATTRHVDGGGLGQNTDNSGCLSFAQRQGFHGVMTSTLDSLPIDPDSSLAEILGLSGKREIMQGDAQFEKGAF